MIYLNQNKMSTNFPIYKKKLNKRFLKKKSASTKTQNLVFYSNKV